MTITCADTVLALKPLSFEFENADSVFVYAIKISHFIGEISRLSALCNAKELARSRRYLSVNDSNRFVVSRALLRLVLSQFTRQNPESIEIEVGPNKKPILKNKDFDLHFNVSHTRQCALIAVAQSPVGIDVEEALNAIEYAPIMETCFSVNEKIVVNLQADALAAFYKQWTRKEAALKCWGKGIDDDIKSLELLNGFNQFGHGDRVFNGGDLMVMSFEMPEHKIAALACTEKMDMNHVFLSNLTLSFLPDQTK